MHCKLELSAPGAKAATANLTRKNDQPGLQVEAEIAEELEKLWRAEMPCKSRGFPWHLASKPLPTTAD